MRTLLIIWIFTSLKLFANEIDSGKIKPVLLYGVSLHKGFILVHSREVSNVRNSYPIGIQFDLAWQQRSLSSFNQCNCFPKIGTSLMLWNYDNPEILGYGAQALFFIEPEYGAYSRLSFAFRAGFGASYSSNPYHETENPDNQSYSTPLNFALYFALRTGLKLSQQSKIDVGAYYNHISNGGYQKPNKGINWPSIQVGYSHYLKPPNFNSFNKSKWDKRVKKRLDVSFFLAWSRVAEGAHLTAPGVEIKGSRQIGKINAITGGTEFIYDNFERHETQNQGLDVDWKKLSVLLGHEFLLGKLVFSQQVGVYLYKPKKEGDDVYQRYGLTYFFTDWLAIGVNIKAHRQVANFVDYRIVFSM